MTSSPSDHPELVELGAHANPTTHKPGTKRLTSLFDNPEFVVGQVLMVIATIAGVYLAAIEGFKQAVKFDYVTSQVDSYNMQLSLRAELIGNLDVIHEFIGHERRTGFLPNVSEWPHLSDHAWSAAREHAAYFELPPPVLTALGKFYEEVPRLIELRKANKVQPKFFYQRLKAHLRLIEGTTLEELKMSIENARQILQERYNYETPLPEIDPPFGWSHEVPIDRPAE